MTESMPALVRRWQAGWGLAKGLHPAAEARGALHVPIGLPGQHVEVVVLDPDEDPDSLRALAAEVAECAHANWLTVPTRQPEAVGPILKAAGLEPFGEPEWLMTADLREHPSRTPPAGYSSAVTVHGLVLEANVTHASGERAAWGTAAVVGADTVAHDIGTDPAHRRRGLGSAVMGALVVAARDRGATTGLLVATPDGQHLYPTLGWVHRATMVVARRPRDR
ncbi:GNAT family N-acetyltransferase [Amycolatopsis anabasis]|uniref:GNAT family N-acetyltransferase n=1 Tax=Amycolatopsis anabasis TaxID=1840409 RepID=UPI00131B8326|nr:GNAT family N-acetyltransferase [Amycolatopsis anabasis]